MDESAIARGVVFAAGILFVIAGLLVIIFRHVLFRFLGRANRSRYELQPKSARADTPGLQIVLGAAFVVAGAVLIGIAIVHPDLGTIR